jgi:hypothetical protein
MVTATVLTVKVALVLPLGTVTVAGTVAAEVLLLVSVTAVPPAGAGPLKVTVPWEAEPPVTLVGLSTRALAAGGVTVRVAVLVTPPLAADIVTVVEADTAVLVTVNVALVLPAVTVTVEGTVAADVLLLVSVTAVPPVGAGPLKVTVPWEVEPPVTLAGLSVRALTAGGVTVRVVVLVTPP